MTTSTLDTDQLDGTWQVDALHSYVGFEVSHMVVTNFRAGFDQPAAVLRVADGVASLTGSAPVSSLTITQPDFRAVMMNPEWFDADNHPEISFASRSLDLAEGGRVGLEGDLTVKGITRPVTGEGTITRPVIDLQGNRRLALELRGEVDRRDFGLGWMMELPGGRPAVGTRSRLVVELALVEA